MGIGISVIDVRLNATGKEIPHKPTGNRIKDQLAQSTHEPTAISPKIEREVRVPKLGKQASRSLREQLSCCLDRFL
jgi:hypothetical protein